MFLPGQELAPLLIAVLVGLILLILLAVKFGLWNAIKLLTSGLLPTRNRKDPEEKTGTDT